MSMAVNRTAKSLPKRSLHITSNFFAKWKKDMIDILLEQLK